MSEKIKILFALPNLKTAGSGREMFHIAERLDKAVFDVWIAVEKEGGALYDEILAKGYPVLIKPFIADKKKGLVEKIRYARAYAKAFRPYHFDIWQSFNWSSDYTEALVAKWAGAKYVYVKKNMNWDRMAWKVKSFLSKAIVARNTDLVRRQLAPPYLRTKTYFITGGVDTSRFYKTDSNAIREQYHIPQDAFLATCIAQLVRVKDQLTLIKAIAPIQDGYVLLAGAARDEAYLAQIHSRIKEYGLEQRVIIAGAVSDVNGLLNATDVFVLPTSRMSGHEEGCPVALLEAMAAGTPCIASNVAGSRDLVIDGHTGLLFEPEHAEQLTAGLDKYRNEPEFAQQMASAARKEIDVAHTLEQESRAFEKMYRKLANRKY